MTQPSPTTDAAPAEGAFCAACGYDLRGIAADRCPECGTTIDRGRAAEAQIPWEHREVIGTWRAYWRTARLSTFDSPQLVAAVAHPVDEPAARRFATQTGLFVALPVALGMLGAMIAMGGTGFLNPTAAGDAGLSAFASAVVPPQADLVLPFAAGVTLWPVVPSGIVLAGLMIVRAARPWFRTAPVSPERRARAAAVSDYACGPLAFAAVGLVAYGVGLLALVADRGPRLSAIGVALAAVGGLLAVAAFIVTWLNTLRLFRRTTHPSGVRLLIAAVAIPVSWYACAAVTLVVMPWVVGFLWLVFDSLR